VKAVIQDRYGPPEVLQLVDLPVPEVSDDQVLIAVHAAGVDRGTWHLTTGLPYLLRLSGYGFRRPRVPTAGRDVAGTVVAIGSAVTGFAVGDQVFGSCSGAYAEYACGPASSFIMKPAVLSFEQAAAAPTSAITALAALRTVGGLQAGQAVLVVGASGGVGAFAVQIAHAMGAEVTAVCSSRGVEFVRSLGADAVIDYAKAPLAPERKYHLILDIAGGRPLRRLRRLLTGSGTLVIVGSETGGRLFGPLGRTLQALLLSPFVRQRLKGLMAFTNPEGLAALSRLIEAGSVTPVVVKSYSLAEAAQAVRQVGEGGILGKVVLSVRA
jgi:NADPH:quinone reductase-like Zn-dependent oxidoreductase